MCEIISKRKNLKVRIHLTTFIKKIISLNETFQERSKMKVDSILENERYLKLYKAVIILCIPPINNK